MNGRLVLFVFLFFSSVFLLPPKFPQQDVNMKYLLHTPSYSSLSRHLASAAPQIVAEEPAELYWEFIIQLGFFNSHILSTDGSNCETLSERTDHLCPNHKPLSSLPPPLKANRWNWSYVHRRLAHGAFIYLHTRHTRIGWNMLTCQRCVYSDWCLVKGAILVKASGA